MVHGPRSRVLWSAVVSALFGACVTTTHTDTPPANAHATNETAGTSASAPTEPSPRAEEAGAEAAASAPSAEPTSPKPKADDGKKRITSVGYLTWIRKKPEIKEGDYLGYVRAGSSIALKSDKVIRGTGCSGGFYEVEPRGYVCRDRTVSDAPRPAWKEAAEASRGTPNATFPYRYAFSNGAPMYNRVPTRAEQERFEKYLGKPGTFGKLPKTLRSHEELAVAESIDAKDALPGFLKDGGSAREAPFDLVEQTIPHGSMLSFTKSFEAEGRTWLLSADHTIVPADRVRPFRPSAFKGADLSKGEAKLPLAFMRVKARPKYEKRGDTMVATGEAWGVRTWVELTGSSSEVGKKRYLETRERGEGGPLYVEEDDATVIDAEAKLPHGIKEGQKWFLVRITNGTMVAYDGLTPVYATLISPGAGGVPVPGRDPVKDSTTPLGVYTITFKDRAATMSPEKGKDRTFWIADVPHTQYFNPPFALHAAYWHERFGEMVSAGCVNLSPIDAERLFGWSDPQVPDEWQGATGAGAKENGVASAVVVRR